MIYIILGSGAGRQAITITNLGVEVLTVPPLPALLGVPPPPDEPFAALRGVLAIPPYQIEDFSQKICINFNMKLVTCGPNCGALAYQIESCIFS